MQRVHRRRGGVGLLLLAAGVACAWICSACQTSQVTGDLGDSLFSKGGLRVRTEPSGATVYINENRVGRAPRYESLQSGIYRVRVEKRGYEPQEQWIEVPKGKTAEVLIRLERG